MRIHHWLALLAALMLLVTAACPAMGQETEEAYITEQDFIALARGAFPLWQPGGGTEAPLTYARALELLCAALGVGGSSPAENLAFAIANDLLPGILYSGAARVPRAEAEKLIAAFAACRDMLSEQARQLSVQASLMTTSAAQPAGAAAMENAMYYFDEPDYNAMNDESYGATGENRFMNPVDSPFSTFALDVDTASYANIRRCLLGGYLPETGAVRIEEMLNYFQYDLPAASADTPVAVTTELGVCPWNGGHLLMMAALTSYTPDRASLPGSNLVFLVDVSGSMEQGNRLPLARRALKLLLSQLTAKDTVTIVTYAGSVGVLLNTTPGDRTEEIARAIDSMNAAGSTNGADGIETAYRMAREAMIEGGNNRVILLTDGDFNVGVQSASGLRTLIERERDAGVYLSVLGFGMGNLKDYEMETLADYGNGNYAYIDTLKEAKKVLVDDMTATLFTVAQDVKLQVEFNPETVSAYRLIGYENRALATEDFLDDTADAGEMGAGHQMIALYEVIPASAGETVTPAAASRYRDVTTTGSGELAYLSVRYRLPGGDTAMECGAAVASGQPTAPMSETLAFASAVAEFGLVLLDSEYRGSAGMEGALSRAAEARGTDAFGYRTEFTQLVALALLLKNP